MFFFIAQKHEYCVVVDFCSIWCTVRDAFFSYGVSPKLTWFFCWKEEKKKKGLEGCSITCLFYRTYERREIGEFFIIVKVWNNQLTLS